MNTNPLDRLSPAVLNRVVLIDKALREFGSRVFYYSPKHIRSIAADVPGYVIDGERFTPTSLPIPLVNGNWTYSTRRLMKQGIGFQKLVEWLDQTGVRIYVPLEFSELVANKHETCKLVRGYRDNLHPHTEPYRQSKKQLEYFFEFGDLIFVKPRTGNKGDQIATIRRTSSGYELKRYEQGRKYKESLPDLKSVAEQLAVMTDNSRRYIIQQGIETLRYEGSVFDLRVVMLYDGEKWDWLHEARFSQPGSDLSNVSQGGVCLVTEELLLNLLGKEAADRVFGELRSESFGLASYLARLHPGALMEIAFDFVIDLDTSLHLVEINTKPGLANVGFSDSVFDMTPRLKPLFEQWVYPHTNSLARFLQSKLDAM